MRLSEFFQHMELIWAVWAVSLLLGGLVSLRLFRSLKAGDWSRLWKSEEGSVYTLSFAMTFPIYLILICLIVETSMMLTAKIGTVYSAYAAARATIVWDSAQPGGQGRARAERAADLGMAPYASASTRHLSLVGGGGGGGTANAFVRAYRHHAQGGDATDGHVRRKFQYAQRATSVQSISSPGAPNGADMTVSVVYRYPFTISMIGRMFGSGSSGGGYFYPIRSEVTLQSEAAITPDRTLGVNYQSY